MTMADDKGKDKHPLEILARGPAKGGKEGEIDEAQAEADRS